MCRHDQRGGRHHVCDRSASRLIVDHLDDLAAIVQTAGRAEDVAQGRYRPIRTLLLDLEARPLVARLRCCPLDFALARCLARFPVVRLDLLRRELIEVDFGEPGLHPVDVVPIVLVVARHDDAPPEPRVPTSVKASRVTETTCLVWTARISRSPRSAASSTLCQ